jgi:hypothetical protein
MMNLMLSPKFRLIVMAALAIAAIAGGHHGNAGGGSLQGH